jgi:GNAT superfamily N-acetyltransferase
VGLRPPTAELEVVATAPLWHGMGLENALIATATRAALGHGCDTIFTIAPPDDQIHTYLRLGFVEVTHILAFWREEDQAQPTAPASLTAPSTTGES